MAKNKEKKEENLKKESQLVTKESLCAVCALFSVLALLILFTNAFIFGAIGSAIHGFLTGVFGYLAYPVFLSVFYISITSLFDKRLIKNRKIVAYITLALLSFVLALHTIFTYSWSLDGYAVACFKAGENFPKCTLGGWVGALLVLAVASPTTKLGAILIFFALAGLFGYLTYAVTQKKATPKTKTAKATKADKTSPTVAPVEIPLSSVSDEQTIVQTPSQPSMVTEQSLQEKPYNYDTVEVPQSPAFTLSDESKTGAQPKQSAGFSPFGVTSTPVEEVATDRDAYERSREFLFGATPEEIYRKNLIFDPNSRANNRPNTPVGQPVAPTYSDMYQTAVNEDTRPVKIFTDKTQTFEQSESISPLSPIQEPTIQPQPVVSYPSYENETVEEIAVEEETPVLDNEPITREETELSRGDSDGYRRHDYMDLFSTENPNVYGDDGIGRRMADEVFSDRTECEDDYLDDRERGRGIDIFDEPEDPYSLRTDFEEEIRGRDSEELPTVQTDRFVERFAEDEPIIPVYEERGVTPVEPVTPVVASEPTKPTPPKPRVIRPYVRVPLDDFDCRDVEPTQNPEEVEETKETIIATLDDFKVTGAAIASVTHGPTVTRYNVTIPRNISPKKVVALDDPIAISLHSSGVNIYPNYDDGVVSIEVPNKDRQFVQLGCMLTGDTFVNAKSSSIMFTMGKDVGNRKVYGDISKMIHLLVAGSSGSGKSVFLGSLIISLIYKYSPEELRLILIDPKKTEFVLYNDLPHLMINEIITDAHKAVQSLNWAIGEMNRRYGLFEQMSRAGTYVVNLDQYNQHVEKNERLPKIVIIIDELADLMLAAKKEVEDRIQNLTQKARAAGIHLVVATQRPSTDVITGVIKSNLNTRIAFAVATDVDSRVILDQSGAQKLLGKGDFLYTMQGINTPIRVQSAFISPEDSQRVVNFIKANNEAYYDENATAYINNVRTGGDGGNYGASGDEVEPVYIDALRCVILSNSASISLIQRKCSIGYNKAGKIVEWMEEMGYISSFDGAKARKVLISKEEFESKYGSL